MSTKSEVPHHLPGLAVPTSRTRHPAIPSRQRASDASLLTRLQAANDRVRRLTDENDKLRRRLAHALGDRRAEQTGQAPRQILDITDEQQ